MSHCSNSEASGGVILSLRRINAILLGPSGHSSYSISEYVLLALLAFCHGMRQQKVPARYSHPILDCQLPELGPK
jgi:hypothetical protein